MDIQLMIYYQKVEGLRQDVALIEKSSFSTEDFLTLVSRHIQTSMVYVTENDPWLSQRFDLQPWSVGYRLIERTTSNQ
jgi:hypothetical protein